VSFSRETTTALVISRAVESRSETVYDPLAVRSAAMTKTNTTETWPHSWMSPLEVLRRGVVDLGRILQAERKHRDEKNPKTNADANSIPVFVAKVT
jgi:hypothetical protein